MAVVNQSMSAPAFLTRATCNNIGDEIENGFTRNKITIIPGSDIATFVSDMRWLDQHINDSPQTLTENEKSRWVTAFLPISVCSCCYKIFPSHSCGLLFCRVSTLDCSVSPMVAVGWLKLNGTFTER
jgi:hypothetical protein